MKEPAITRGARSLALMVGAIVLNIALGYLVQNVLQWPLYLDSLGAILAGALLGPLTMAVGAAANNLLLVSPYQNIGITAQDWLRVGIFVVVSLAIAATANQLEKSKRELQAQQAGQARLQAGGLASLTDEERSAVAIALMRHRNKVTHVFELVKAYGSTSQVQYDRAARVWQRRENIAAKHAYEVAVNPFSGEKLAGDGHAPLVYTQDPRADLPAELQGRLAAAIEGSDERIVAGWLQYGLAGGDEAL